MEENQTIIQLHKYQDEAVFSSAKVTAAIGGVQSGKTISGAIWTNRMLDERKEDNGLIVSNDYRMLEQSTLQKLFEINPALAKFYKKQKGIIELPDGRMIYLRSAERPESVEGFTAGWAWLDEGAKYRLKVWINVQARLAIKKGPMFISTTPDAINWLYYDVYDKFLKGDKDFRVVQWRSIDNPYFSAEEYERAKRMLSPNVFRRRYEGSFEQMEGLVYLLQPHLVCDACVINNRKDCIAGVDFGYTNPSAVSVIVMDSDGVYWIVDEVYREKMTNNELVEICKQLRDKWGITKFYPDPAEPDRIEEMRRAGLYVREVKKDILAGISEVQNLLHQGRIKIFNTCRHHIEEFNTYHNEPGTEDRNKKEKPLPFNDHLMDAVRYALTTFSYVPPKPLVYSYKPMNLRTGY
jgi:phage terminase large subunit